MNVQWWRGVAAAALTLPLAGFAGGPKYVAGSSYFDPGVMGQPVRWAGGTIQYWVDQGPLSTYVTHEQAVTMVDAAAALWSAVPTAGVKLTNGGSLNEDVNGANAAAANRSFAAPSDITPSAANYPLAVVFDADGSVVDALFGSHASDPTSCQLNGVRAWTDNIRTDATAAHAVVLINGRCADTAARVQMLSFQLERAFGQVLGLGWSQTNPGAMRSGDSNQTAGMAVMQPGAGGCGSSGGACIPDPGRLRFDDIAALNRLYPITAANLAAFPGKELTAENTISITGTVAFRFGTGMQGVNVVARPLDANGNPLYAYTVTAVSGAYYRGDHGSVVNGWNDAAGTPLTQWGSEDAPLQGYFDLRYIPLPPGATSARYQITFETMDPLYIYDETVGPYVQGSPAPSGTLSPAQVETLAAGDTKALNITVQDSAAGGYNDAISTEGAPRVLPASGLWCGRLSHVGQTDWFNFPVRGNRTFTIVTEALNEQGIPVGNKAMPAIGVWDAFAPVGSASAGTAPGLNGNAPGETWLRVTTEGDDVVRMGIADMRGDGRPDYAYNGWVLYADSVTPRRLPLSGGPIVIRGMGFHAVDTVRVNGKAAQVTSVSPNQISAIAPAADPGVTGDVDVEVDDAPLYYAQTILSGELSYEAGTADSLKLVTAPANTVPSGVPLPFAVTALSSKMIPAGGVTVVYAVRSGTAKLGCSSGSCGVATNGDGTATMTVTAVDGTPSVVVATLSNGASVEAHFSGGTPPVLSALNPSLSLAAGATVTWTAQALALSGGTPASGQTVVWQSGAGIAITGTSSVTTSATGVAAKALTVGPLAKGQQATATACLNGTSQCVTFTVLGARPEFATVAPVAGWNQSLAVGAAADQIALRVLDMNGNPMAGGTVILNQAVYAWAPPCPPHGRCAQPELLSTQTAMATSGLDGMVTFAPATIAGVATNTIGIASTGDASTAAVAIERHP